MKTTRASAKPKPGRIFVISGPSGSGKTTLVKRLLSVLKKQTGSKRLVWSVSVTTRKPRRGERRNRDYIFLSKKEFLRRRGRNEFLEWARVGDACYATPKDAVNKQLECGRSAVLTIDVQGAAQVKKKFPKAILIFILPPSLAVLQRRLNRRCTESGRQIKRRLKLANREIASAKNYDFVLVNRQLKTAVRQLKKIIYDELLADR